MGSQHHVIVEVEEMLGDAWDAVQVRLNGWRRKDRQVGWVWKNLVMSDELDLLVGEIQPRRDLPIRNDVDLAEPRRMLPDRAHRIFHLVFV